MSAVPSHRILCRVEIDICQACLNGEGRECHTPGCAMWLHRVDLPFDPNQYKVLETFIYLEDDVSRAAIATQVTT